MDEYDVTGVDVPDQVRHHLDSVVAKCDAVSRDRADCHRDCLVGARDAMVLVAVGRHLVASDERGFGRRTQTAAPAKPVPPDDDAASGVIG
jgi:hypothetical protein